jgi:hypothetical protein
VLEGTLDIANDDRRWDAPAGTSVTVKGECRHAWCNPSDTSLHTRWRHDIVPRCTSHFHGPRREQRRAPISADPIMRTLITTVALLALLGGPTAIAQTTGSATSSVEPASPTVPSSPTPDTRSIGSAPAGHGAFIGGLATGYAVAIVAAGRATNHDPSGVETFWPIEGISYQLGSKLAVGYFEPRNGECQVTLMIAEAVDPDQARPSSAARLSLPIRPGGRASLASEEGRSIEITCGEGAQTVAVKCSASCSGRP